ncbi:MAG: DUF5110 domain-containing protein [Prevotella sp.]|nr:DUF5110 domain-containing protein [Prevotella sp.]
MRKRTVIILVLPLFILLISGCNGSRVQRYSQGIIVLPACGDSAANVPRAVRLQVEGENIIRVTATAEKTFADPQSLIIVDREVTTPLHNVGCTRQSEGKLSLRSFARHFDVEENGDTVTLSTSRLKARVLISTGEVAFLDSADNAVLQERESGGKTFAPYEVTRTTADGEDRLYKGWTTRAVFESPDGEAFFGLGQHQANEWNYKGKNEELYQYNTKVSIPFIVSSRNYGLLFDTYSLCRFGNPEEYKQLGEMFTLVDKDGVEGALTGTYTSPGLPDLTRREDSLYFEDLRSAKNLPDYPLERAKVVYEGTIIPRATGEYRFCHYYSGYQRIYIDGQDVYTEDVAGTGSNEQTIWRSPWNPNARKFALYLEEGKAYPFKLEWTPDGGEAYCGVRAYAPVNETEQGRLSFWSEMSRQMDYYFILGDNADEVISGYRTLTGKAQIMPEWLFGYWQSRERYKTQEEILDALQGFRNRHLPIDNIVMDWNYWVDDEWGAFTFDPERFPDPKGMIDSIHARNAKIMISCWPKYYLKPDNFKELNDKGMMYQQSLRDSIYDWLGYMYAFYDAYNADARKIFWRQLYENLGTIGMDAWWMDASEPNIRDCTDMEYRKLLCGPTALGSSDEYFNAYSVVNAEAIYDGQRAYDTAGFENTPEWLAANTSWDQRGFGNTFSPDNRRVFLLTRNGFASEQRYSTATWSGDIGTRWEDMEAQITAGLNFSISGVPYWSQDIGGFSVEKRYEAAQNEYDRSGIINEDLRDWRELNTRWHEFGMWAPIYRAHGQFPYREPWNIAPEGSPAYEAIRSCLELRYRLLPYIYSLAADVYFNDYTIMRPLVMDFGTDKAAYDIGDQFMFGPAFMINPVYTYKARKRTVYFPAGADWYDFFTGEPVSGGGESLTADAPFEHIPVFVRAGSIVPFGKEIEYTRQMPNDVMRIYVWTGADGHFTLYEDEGTNYGYEAGRYATIPFDYDEATRTLTIGKRTGSFPGMLEEREFVIVTAGKDKAQPYDPDAEGQKITYNGAATTVRL